MCSLCDRVWLGSNNSKWGMKHLDYDARHRGRWKTCFSVHRHTYKDAVNRRIAFNYRDSSAKRYI